MPRLSNLIAIEIKSGEIKERDLSGIEKFVKKYDLGMAGVFTAVFYGLTVVLIGLLFFGESISLVKWLGIVFALVGIVLMNLGI